MSTPLKIPPRKLLWWQNLCSISFPRRALLVCRWVEGTPSHQRGAGAACSQFSVAPLRRPYFLFWWFEYEKSLYRRTLRTKPFISNMRCRKWKNQMCFLTSAFCNCPYAAELKIEWFIDNMVKCCVSSCCMWTLVNCCADINSKLSPFQFVVWKHMFQNRSGISSLDKSCCSVSSLWLVILKNLPTIKYLLLRSLLLFLISNCTMELHLDLSSLGRKEKQMKVYHSKY